MVIIHFSVQYVFLNLAKQGASQRVKEKLNLNLPKTVATVDTVGTVATDMQKAPKEKVISLWPPGQYS